MFGKSAKPTPPLRFYSRAENSRSGFSGQSRKVNNVATGKLKKGEKEVKPKPKTKKDEKHIGLKK